MAKLGRPPLPKKVALTQNFCARLRSDEARDVKQAISKSGRTRSEWIRNALLTAARKT